MAQAKQQTNAVVTGVAAQTPIGLGYQAMKQGLRKSEPSVAQLSQFGDEPAASSLWGAELREFDAKTILGKKGLRNKDRNTLIVLSCIQMDLASHIEAIGQPDDVGLVLGTTFGSLASQVSFTANYIKGGFRAVNAMEFPNMVINAPPSQGNIWFDLAASSATISNGFTAGLDAVIFAADQIVAGRAKHLIAGGSDELSLHLTLAFDKAGLTSPSHRLAPLGDSRDGTLVGEGAAMVLVESREIAQRRGARVLAEILGHGSTFDGGMDYGFNPKADGASGAMHTALSRAGLRPQDIDFIAASANGSRDGDQMEIEAIHRVFGADAAKVPVVAYKSYFGECFAATGAMQLAAALADLEDGVISKTCGFGGGAHGLRVTSEPLALPKATTVMINSFGYSGQNSSLILRAPRG